MSAYGSRRMADFFHYAALFCIGPQWLAPPAAGVSPHLPFPPYTFLLFFFSGIYPKI